MKWIFTGSLVKFHSCFCLACTRIWKIIFFKFQLVWYWFNPLLSYFVFCPISSVREFPAWYSMLVYYIAFYDRGTRYKTWFSFPSWEFLRSCINILPIYSMNFGLVPLSLLLTLASITLTSTTLNLCENKITVATANSRAKRLKLIINNFELNKNDAIVENMHLE